jgi:competence protein ComEA
MQIFLGEGFPEPGIRQFTDGMTVGGVIELTGVGGAIPTLLADPLSERRLYAGAVLDIAGESSEYRWLSLGWLPARQRLALGIPLHPDRMSREDWISLPGIGEKLAAQIEVDRQYYGDFGRLAALERVKGIGPGKLKALQPFFVDVDN